MDRLSYRAAPSAGRVRAPTLPPPRVSAVSEDAHYGGVHRLRRPARDLSATLAAAGFTHVCS